MRTKGTVVKREKPAPAVPVADQSEERKLGTIVRGDRPEPPNWICYHEAFKGLVDEKGRWLGKGRVPKCRVCRGWLQPEENHKCPGYMPRMDRLQPMDLEQRRDMREASWEEAGDWDDDQYDATTDADIPAVVRYGEEWDDDHFDPTTAEGADFMMHEAETGETKDNVVLREDWTEDDWIEWRRQQLGHSKHYDPKFDPDDE
jgi:hypothetical protein